MNSFEKESEIPPLLYAIGKSNKESLRCYRGALSTFKEKEAEKYINIKYFLCEKDPTQRKTTFTPIVITDVTELVEYCAKHLKITPKIFAQELEKINRTFIHFWNKAINWKTAPEKEIGSSPYLLTTGKELLQTKITGSKKHRIRSKKTKNKCLENTTIKPLQESHAVQNSNEEEFFSCEEEDSAEEFSYLEED